MNSTDSAQIRNSQSNIHRHAAVGLLWTCATVARAVNPPPDGGYPGGNTAEGQNALLSLNNDIYNTATGTPSATPTCSPGGSPGPWT